jgi:hypothetical protein
VARVLILYPFAFILGVGMISAGIGLTLGLKVAQKAGDKFGKRGGLAS